MSNVKTISFNQSLNISSATTHNNMLPEAIISYTTSSFLCKVLTKLRRTSFPL